MEIRNFLHVLTFEDAITLSHLDLTVQTIFLKQMKIAWKIRTMTADDRECNCHFWELLVSSAIEVTKIG